MARSKLLARPAGNTGHGIPTGYSASCSLQSLPLPALQAPDRPSLVQLREAFNTAWTCRFRPPHHSRVRVLPHIKKLDDCFGDFMVRVSCVCGASRHIEPEALARLVGWRTTLEALAPRLRCSQCGRTGGYRVDNMPNRQDAHGFRTYVCVLKWKPTSETTDRVSIRRAGSRDPLLPATENAVYRKALVDPQIRSRVLQAARLHKPFRVPSQPVARDGAGRAPFSCTRRSGSVQPRRESGPYPRRPKRNAAPRYRFPLPQPPVPNIRYSAGWLATNLQWRATN
jgi:hypothetical protein